MSTAIQPDSWATSSGVEDGVTTFEHDYETDSFAVNLTHIYVSGEDYGTTAHLTWRSADPSGKYDVENFTVRLDDIPALIDELHRICTTTTGTEATA